MSVINSTFPGSSTLATPTSSSASARTGTEAPDTVAPSVGTRISTSGDVRSLETVIVTTADVNWSPDMSVAIAIRSWSPFRTSLVFHVTSYGALGSVPMGTPSTRNSTLAMSTPSETPPWTRRNSPDTVAPSVGDTIDTVDTPGPPPPPPPSLNTVTVTTADVAWFPEPSVAIAVKS